MEPSSDRRRRNPIAFTPWPVTIISTVIYLALFIPLLVVQHVLPPVPKSGPSGVSLGDAWRDLQHLTSGFHPYNSHRNDEVHDWLVQRIHEVLDTPASTEESHLSTLEAPDVFVFDDDQSNLTFADRGIGDTPTTGVYFESKNILVYIRGSEDDPERWWENPDGEPRGPGGVLVNAHYDSVSTGFGATDDGVGVVTLLQLLKYFTQPSNRPRKGLVLLFNDGEEDYLNGARVYSQHPLSKFPHTFLNLEGAGAGGRAALFRTTDTEVAKFYERAKHPYGSVMASDGFELGLIKSQTDYVILNGVFGLRGLDVAFLEPRSRYHTDQDDVRHTSPESVWHMLSGAISTTEGLVSYRGSAFDGPTEQEGKVDSGTGTRGVWFDVFGSAFAVFRLHTLFALSVTLLVVPPLVLITTGVILAKKDKMYLFSTSKTFPDGEQKVPLKGLRGLFRFPVIVVISSAVTIAMAYLVTKVNPFIVHSSPYAVWCTMISIWVFLAWFVARIADFLRPSALHRAYALTWLFLVTWILLVVNTVYENQHQIAAGYSIVFFFAGTFLATWISYLEMFALPRKTDFASHSTQPSGDATDSERTRLLSQSTNEPFPEFNTNDGRSSERPEDEVTESTSLLGPQQRTTFANYTRTRLHDGHDNEDDGSGTPGAAGVFGYEQQWSAKLPTWTWGLQFIFLAPIVIILVGPLALFLTAAMNQIGQDGVSVFVVYISIAIFTILLLLPVSPFIHRLTYHIPVFLILVFTGTLIYNLVAFPFSAESRLKLFFLQEVDLDTGYNQVSLAGVQPYLKDAISTIPSASGQNVTCDLYDARYKCSWEGLAANVAMPSKANNSDDWVSYNITRANSEPKAKFEISGKNTRSCRLLVDHPIKDYTVSGSAVDSRMPHMSPNGISEVRLWSRTWENTWTVNVEWDPEHEELRGRVVCIWSDDNDMGVIPALDEVRLYAPAWVAITKLRDGLVEASRAFRV